MVLELIYNEIFLASVSCAQDEWLIFNVTNSHNVVYCAFQEIMKCSVYHYSKVNPGDKIVVRVKETDENFAQHLKYSDFINFIKTFKDNYEGKALNDDPKSFFFSGNQYGLSVCLNGSEIVIPLVSNRGVHCGINFSPLRTDVSLSAPFEASKGALKYKIWLEGPIVSGDEIVIEMKTVYSETPCQSFQSF